MVETKIVKANGETTRLDYLMPGFGRPDLGRVSRRLDQSAGSPSLGVPFDPPAGGRRRPSDGSEPKGRPAEERSQGVVNETTTERDEALAQQTATAEVLRRRRRYRLGYTPTVLLLTIPCAENRMQQAHFWFGRGGEGDRDPERRSVRTQLVGNQQFGGEALLPEAVRDGAPGEALQAIVDLDLASKNLKGNRPQCL